VDVQREPERAALVLHQRRAGGGRRLPGSSIADALRRAVDELIAAAGTERSAIPAAMPVRD
jgi:hypothetical protein